MRNIFFNDKVLGAEKKIISSLRIPPAILMENAGANCAAFILNNFRNYLNDQVIIVAGKGNNGGDGFVTARHLSIGNVKVKILTLAKESELKNAALLNYNIIKDSAGSNISVIYCNDAKDIINQIPDQRGILIDAIFGVGFKGTPDNKYRKIIEYLNSLTKKIIISLDTPSGLYNYDQNSTAVKADLTLTIGVKKFHSLFYLGRKYSGKIEVMNMGVAGDQFTKYNSGRIFEIEKDDVSSFLPVRDINSNKYSNGKVFILSGSKGLTGAAALCSMAALRTGSGAVVTGIPESVSNIMAKKLTEVMTLPLAETTDSSLSMNSYDEIKSRLKWADAILIGPGLSKNEETMKLVRKIVKENDLNFVIDADAISAFRGHLNLLKNKKIILTPHFGEFANLLSKDTEYIKNNFYELAKKFAKDHRIILVLKNSPSIVTNGNETYVNPTGKENLATAGSGDVLSGIITSLFSQNKNILESALAGVYIHGMCGDNLYQVSGADSTIAGDLINEISKVKKDLAGK